MILPDEVKLDLTMTIADGVVTNSMKVWEMLEASSRGELGRVVELVEQRPELAYAQYNYAPPIHFAVREGHEELVEFLLFELGAYDPEYRTYPFLDRLETIADDRGWSDIGVMLRRYESDSSLQKFKGDNGAIDFKRTPRQKEFESAVDAGDIDGTKRILDENPKFAVDTTYFWGEGILCMPAKQNNRGMMLLLIGRGARVPKILKWAQAYYFERYEAAEFLMEHRMDPNTMSCHRVTLLHDMAQKGEIAKAKLLLDRGADIDAIDEEYRSTPLGLAARWGNTEMVEFLLERGADPQKSGSEWSPPLVWARKKGHARIEEILRAAGG